MNTIIGAKTHFSLGESIVSPEKLVETAKKLGYEAIAVADVDSLNSLTKVYQAAKKHEIEAVIGVTFTVVDDINWRRASRGEPKAKPNPFFRPTVYVQNEEGLKDVMQLLSQANSEDNFYYKAQIDLSQLLATIKRGNVAVTTGTTFSLFSHASAQDILLLLTSALTTSDLIVELCPVNTPYFDRINKLACEWLNSQQGHLHPAIISRPVLHSIGESDLRNTMNCILNRDKVDSMWRNTPNEGLDMLSDADMGKEIEAMSERVKSISDLSQMNLNGVLHRAKKGTRDFKKWMHYEWDKMPISLPDMASNPYTELMNLCKEGWKKRIGKPVLGYKPEKDQLPEYKERLRYELTTLHKMGFENYFLLVEQVVGWCKQEDIMVGPGRGSVGGSLVAFLIGITDVDPIRFGLIFERFINPDRLDLPDVDLDFMSTRRHEVIEHLVEEFGRDHVAGISNYGELGSSSAIRSVGSAHNLTDSDISCSKLVPKEHGQSLSLEESVAQVAEIEAFALAYPKIWEESCGLQGTFKNYGKHAAGIVVAGEPIKNRAVLENRGGDRVINWDKRVVEDFGLVKLDILGLSTLDVLSLAKDYVKEATGETVDYTQLPLNEPKVMEAFGRGDTVGVFQFESGGMRHLLKSLASSGTLKFEDLSAATALYRPGPMESGMMEDYVAINQGAKMISYEHPNMEAALSETNSIIVYQEQVMQLSRDLAGFTMTDADHLRKAMGKKDKDKMAEQRGKWVDGCLKTSGMDGTASGMLFDQIEQFAGYGFNKSHSVEYSIISYWTMWLKITHPSAFYAAALTVLGDDKMKGIAKDAERDGYFIVPPDINKSSDRFEIGYDSARKQRVLYAPFQSVKGLSEKGAAAILEAKATTGAFKSKQHFIDSVNRRSCNVRVQTALDDIGAFASIEQDQIDARHPDRLKRQKELLPGIIVQNVAADRRIIITDHSKDELNQLLNQTRICTDCSLAGTNHPAPVLGSKAKIMIITDCPNWSEDQSGKMGTGKASESLLLALKENGLTKKDYYITSLVKAYKGQGKLQNEMINGCSKYLEQEIELLKPPIIVTLGSMAARHLLPNLKGGWEQIAGHSEYDVAKNCTIICGFNPAMIHFDDSKQGLLNDIFKEIKELV